MWIARAMHEIREANRTWFATFTLRPMEHYNMQSRGALHALARSIPMEELSTAELSKLQSAATFKELQKYFKRVRKECGSRTLRYLIVQEDHKSGLPHYHALIHECGEIPIRYSVLAKNWTLGFTNFKLVNESETAAFYVAKYLKKADGSRVRASLGYGRAASRPQTASAIKVLATLCGRDDVSNASKTGRTFADTTPPHPGRSGVREALAFDGVSHRGLLCGIDDLCEQETK